MSSRFVLTTAFVLSIAFSSDDAVQASPPGYGYRPNPYRVDPYRRPPAYASPREYRSYGPSTYRPVYTYPPAYWTYRPWYTYPPAFWAYGQPGFEYRGTSLPPSAMPGFQLAW